VIVLRERGHGGERLPSAVSNPVAPIVVIVAVLLLRTVWQRNPSKGLDCQCGNCGHSPCALAVCAPAKVGVERAALQPAGLVDGEQPRLREEVAAILGPGLAAAAGALSALRGSGPLGSSAA